ncbi:SGNH/GDSL hydrolase family protein [Ginsengibacter hankyongi]|uniref:SGNH/GDSL hydrolase family protein n=1 Tax=Ginsengibacter hankyongi TaxID=2607284 RepID=A0A5J5ICK3_9BACT|nr:SGNH/GDSL hydrolase family protein [Ginsengibacter hankyongi]KAA9035539.1 SGNH/GDSL hydrolase family protein [Ginsengibacter hankyongi]
MKRIIYLPIIFLSLISCIKKNDSTFINMPPVDTSDISKDTSTKTYLALGDSYTIGQSVPDYERFPVQTVIYLRAKNISIKDADIIAVTGWTTGDLLNALNNNPPKNNYSFVTLLIGVNNQYQGRTLDEYKTQFTELLNRSVAYAGNNKHHVFVLSIPDYSVTPFADGRDTMQIAKEIDEFNAANKTISLNAGVNYIDITPISRNAKNDASLIAKDGLHPSGIQYKKWVDLLVPSVLQQIK